MRFLAVDDDPTFLEVLRNFMKGYDQHVLCTANSAAEALEMVRREPSLHDGFLLDIFMPGMNGIELCAELRAMAPFRDVPIIMLTVASQRHMIDDAFVAGATDYLLKPLESEDFETRLKMAQQLHEQLCQSQTLEGRARKSDPRYPRIIDFDAPMPMRGQKGAIRFAALENYLVTLDRRGLIAHSVFGVHFETASQVFIRSDAAGFVEALGDVARAISEGLEGQKILFAYAGAGDFVVTALHPDEIDMRVLEVDINAALAKYTGVSVVKGLPAPRVRVGNAVRNGLFGERSAKVVLWQAIRNARGAESPAISVERDLERIRRAMKQ